MQPDRTVEFEAFVASKFEGYVTQWAPHEALTFIACCKLMKGTYVTRRKLHAADVTGTISECENEPSHSDGFKSRSRRQPRTRGL